ncbi:hypothetical protein DdX_08070 [Ditylenchus destructor]|uniref:Uncharacterized protein n=1 Tax=Ditylenchus destructor TaxID=166010 RepID=A0AAD4N2U4_9BILA|nr:hypothetical protein DdX_08070 [Ditylenchus destructor]
MHYYQTKDTKNDGTQTEKSKSQANSSMAPFVKPTPLPVLALPSRERMKGPRGTAGGHYWTLRLEGPAASVRPLALALVT